MSLNKISIEWILKNKADADLCDFCKHTDYDGCPLAKAADKFGQELSYWNPFLETHGCKIVDNGDGPIHQIVECPTYESK